ncbi:hypothetical protein SAMN05216428_10540 [Nitrosospira sp. Nsp11]|uniref:hypothetical protein n=1 Tax=Nitrosospira sp. Nsp11 TaxID=1855338 RepID=UPI00091DFD12|nr:hypothetical protein [Nitrosospira sp. Nsp11]SHL69725.1 hypothetical protein SAMN05216428_10540 [Nitrosospira sp. Nsp11]
MSALILPRRFKQQPQAPAPIDWTNPLAFGLAAATVFDTAGAVFDRVTGVKYQVTNGAYRADKPGRVTSFAGAGYVNTGKQSLGGVNLFADSTSQWSVVIYARLEGTGNTGTFVGKASATGASRTFQIYCDAAANHNPGIWLRGAQTIPNWGWGNADWHQYTITWDGSIAKLYGDYGREVTLVVGAAGQESENIVFGARTGGTGGLLTGRIAYGYFYNRAIGRAESIALYNNPWLLFKASPKKLWNSTICYLTAETPAQANFVDMGAVAQDHALVGAALTQNGTAKAGTLIQDQALAAAPAVQTSASNADGRITQNQILAAVSNAQTNMSGTGVVTQARMLIVPGGTQGQACFAPAITQAHIIVAAAPTQDNTSTTGFLYIGRGGLEAEPVVQGNSAGAAIITQTHILIVSFSNQGNKAGTGAVSDGIIVESALSTGMVATLRIKKPGIPAGTPEWLKTMIELLIGRRGNRIMPPAFRALTFSAVPTRAECEALYAYTNDVRIAVERIITRLDS